MENVISQKVCIHCGGGIPLGSHFHRKYCSANCKRKYHASHDSLLIDGGHICRVCGDWFAVGKGQHNKWLCSPKCRREGVARSTREFHKRRPEMEQVYRARTKEKKLPDSNLVRFYRWNPDAPRECESCAERRVLDVAHKPGYERIGEHRKRDNSLWPEMVWVLCPTCHSLIDRMNYEPRELGLT